MEEKKNNKTNNIIRIVAIISIIIILVIMNGLLKKEKKKYDDLFNYMEAVNDTLVSYRNKDSSQVYQIQSISISNIAALRKIKTQDSLILRLQKLDKNTESGVVFNDEVNIRVKDTVTIVHKDTVYLDGYRILYPEYRYTIINEWFEATSVSNKDTGYLDLKIINKYDVSLKYNRNIPYAIITSYNPYSDIKEVRAVNTRVEDNKIGIDISLQVGYGITDNFNFKPYIGVGISKPLIRF